MFGSVLPASDSTGVSTSSTPRSAKNARTRRLSAARRRSASRRCAVGLASPLMRARARNASSCASSHTSTPSSCALSSLEPAASPATTKLVFFDTLPATLAPSASSLLLRLVAAHRRQRAGQHHGLALQRPGGQLRRARAGAHAARACAFARAQQQPGVGLDLQPCGQRAGGLGGRPAVTRLCDRRIQQRPARRRMPRQLRGAQRRDLRDVEIRQQRRQVERLAQLRRRRMRVADAHAARQQARRSPAGCRAGRRSGRARAPLRRRCRARA